MPPIFFRHIYIYIYLYPVHIASPCQARGLGRGGAPLDQEGDGPAAPQAAPGLAKQAGEGAGAGVGVCQRVHGNGASDDDGVQVRDAP